MVVGKEKEGQNQGTEQLYAFTGDTDYVLQFSNHARDNGWTIKTQIPLGFYGSPIELNSTCPERRITPIYTDEAALYEESNDTLLELPVELEDLPVELGIPNSTIIDQMPCVKSAAAPQSFSSLNLFAAIATGMFVWNGFA